MNNLNIEKKRIGKGRYGMCVAGWFFYLITIHSQLSTYRAPFLRETIEAKYFPFITQYFVIGGFFALLYTAQQLFAIKEQGKRILIVKKYQITPLTRSEFYIGKIRILLETSAIYLLGSVIVYLFVIASSSGAASFMLGRMAVQFVVATIGMLLGVGGMAGYYYLAEVMKAK